MYKCIQLLNNYFEVKHVIDIILYALLNINKNFNLKQKCCFIVYILECILNCVSTQCNIVTLENLYKYRRK